MFGAGAAACAVCGAAPILALVGIAGAEAVVTLATIAFAGIDFGLVVLAATLLGVGVRRRTHATASPCVDEGPIDVTITLTGRP